MQHDDAWLENIVSNPTWFLLVEGLVDIAHLFFTPQKIHGLIEDGTACQTLKVLKGLINY